MVECRHKKKQSLYSLERLIIMSTVNAETVAEIVKRNFNFSVDKFRLSGPDNMKTPFYGLFRSDDASSVGQSCKAGYVPHTTEDVLALTEAAQCAFDNDVQVDCHFDNGHYLKISPNMEKRKSIFGTADNIFPRILINASYNGRAFRASMGWFRDLCMNMAEMKQISGTSVNIRHSTGLRGKMDALIAQFNTLKQSWGTLETVIEGLESHTVNLASFMTEVYGEPSTTEGRGLTIHQNRTEAIISRVISERQRSGRPALTPGNVQVSAWEAYNAIQGYSQHVATRKGNPGSFARIIAANNDKAVLKAESLVLAL